MYSNNRLCTTILPRPLCPCGAALHSLLRFTCSAGQVGPVASAPPSSAWTVPKPLISATRRHMSEVLSLLLLSWHGLLPHIGSRVCAWCCDCLVPLLLVSSTELLHLLLRLLIRVVEVPGSSASKSYSPGKQVLCAAEACAGEEAAEWADDATTRCCVAGVVGQRWWRRWRLRWSGSLRHSTNRGAIESLNSSAHDDTP